MKSVTEWLDEYAVSHQNPTNKRIHWLCVPLIVFSLIGLLWSLPRGPLSALSDSLFFNWGSLFMGLALLYYLILSRALFPGMTVVSGLTLAGNSYLDGLNTPLWLISLIIFVGAWIGQFIGHKIEGRKPSFFKDLQFLLIGPLWCLSFLYDKLGIPYGDPRKNRRPA